MGYDFDAADPGVVSSHARAFASHPDFELAGGVDPDATACARFRERYGGWAGGDLAEGLTTVRPEVVVIAAPTAYHAEAVRMALQYARPRLILCEKPLAYALDEATAMVAACREADCLLYVNYLRRVEPGVLEIRRRLQDGRIAMPLKGVLWYTKGLLHNGSHFSNLLEFWLGPIEKFMVINPGRAWGDRDIEPDVQVTFAGGEVTFLAASEEHFSHHEIQLVAPNGCLRYEQGGAKILWQAAGPDPAFPEYTVLSLPGERVVTESRALQWQVTDNVSLRLRGKPTNLCSGEDALQTLESLLKMKAAL
ncbi:Gfo/Idh/MocA family oxidoreductase [Polaromonas sp.]|uniref:Gfo/Idh/MocA family protein n=1 Tax=Polaromonas sp. TaxID=1869339 RepID=UPI003263B267